MDGQGKEPNSSANQKKTSTKPEQAQHFRWEDLYVVGVGGSAGGLEAFERLFEHMPDDTGIAFVVIQHLEPTHKALMPELLQRVTSLEVIEITDGIQVEPDKIFVLPAGQFVSIQNGRLSLSPTKKPHGTRSPIDSFFTSLAAEKKEKAIGIIVSGMGMDGTVGIKAIKEELGAVLVQDPVSAKYDGMPSSAVASGVADYVVPVEDMPTILVSYVQHSSRLPQRSKTKDTHSKSSIQAILDQLRNVTGHDFSLYKKGTLYRRIERRVNMHHLDGIASYARLLEDNPSEANALFRDLFIGVTSFFRDPAAFDKLMNEVFPELLQDKAEDDTVRIWVAGCSTGEEAYSLIIALQEALDRTADAANIKIQVFATDIDAGAIETARRGIYAESAVEGVSAQRLDRFFVRTDDGFQVKRNIREAVVFAQHNIISDPPFTKLDLISCRNLMIYFAAELQKKLIPVFHYALNPNGILFLGSSETISGYSNLFTTIDNKSKIFRRREYPAVWTGMVDLRSPRASIKPREPGATLKEERGSVPEVAQRVILAEYAPAAIVIDENGDILYVSGRTGKYLELPTGKASSNLLAMARQGLRYELGAAIRRATTEKTIVNVKGLSILTDSGNQFVDLTVRPFSHPEGLEGLLLVVFEDAIGLTVSQPPDVEQISADTGWPGRSDYEQELKRTKEYLQATMEEMQSTQEEMLSANEEFQSTNEELQSTNEELMTSKEELQSLNEELTTVNTELQMKNEELTVTNNDMVNLLNSTQIATIFLDTDLNVRRFTPSVSGIINLRQSDTGRPVADIAPNLMYETLVSDATEVLHTLATKEAQVETREGLWFVMRMMPYRTLDNVIDGVVVTFSDITLPKRLEESLRKSESQFHSQFEEFSQLFKYTPVALFVLDPELNFLRANERLAETNGIPLEAHIGHSLYDILPTSMVEELKVIWAPVFEKGEAVLDVEVTGETPKQPGVRRYWLASYFPLKSDTGEVFAMAGAILDITLRKRMEQLSDALNQINAAMISTVDFDDVMARVLKESVEAMGVESGSITLHEDRLWVVRYAYGTNKMRVGTSFSDEDIPEVSTAAQQKRIMAVNDVGSFDNGNYRQARQHDIAAFAAIPLIVGDEPVGILWLNSHSKPFDFGEAEIDFATKLAASVTLALENVRLYNEERDARSREETLRSSLQVQHSEMQRALLPGTIPAVENCEIATRFVPGTAGEQIGGDFYDVFKTEDGKIGIVIGDVSGKGVEAGALAAVTRSTVRAFAYELASPGDALTHTNSVISKQGFAYERFATVFLVILDPISGRLTYATAGHPPAMIVKTDANVELLGTGSLPIRVDEGAVYNSMQSVLSPGDKLVLYTDGISEAHSHARMYDIDGIAKTLQHQVDSEPDEMLDMLFCVAGDISEGTLVDDAAVIVLEWQGKRDQT